MNAALHCASAPAMRLLSHRDLRRVLASIDELYSCDDPDALALRIMSIGRTGGRQRREFQSPGDASAAPALSALSEGNP